MAKNKMDKTNVKIISIEKRESFVRVELEYEGEEYRGLLLKHGIDKNGISEKSEK